MVTQFGYVALWSTIWPLAPLMALTNNWFELRSDAFKIAKHVRRPIPARTDTIGPWLDTLQFLAWLAFLTNSALVYLFRPLDHCKALGTSLDRHHTHLAGRDAGPREILEAALLVALGRVAWEREAETVETAVKEEYMRSLGVADVAGAGVGEIAEADAKDGDGDAFWTYDEGLDELSRETKES
ncbi:hypothetical protein EVJ58_g9821 [Rhodofomes roseus]|uniref:Anoctamin transmembrane domain-containing protein n=1 Tax=Rhodofomes roseus TaxID=34475 RepID=A0A4Y9XR31_9APHY|nr:hypothetical protein EVJ58_g9821 [Rhodofomes roseus]